MKNIAQILVETGAVKVNFENPFVWTSGIKSPIYCDCRELTGLVEARNTIVDAFVDLIRSQGLSVDIVAGTATAGISWAALVADRIQAPMLYVRSKPKGHGAGRMVEGKFEMEQNILVVEDAFSTAGSAVKSAEALRTECKATVTDLVGIFSWETPLATTNTAEAKLNLTALTGFSEITEALLLSGQIDEAQKESLEKFHDNPTEWNA